MRKTTVEYLNITTPVPDSSDDYLESGWFGSVLILVLFVLCYKFGRESIKKLRECRLRNCECSCNLSLESCNCLDVITSKCSAACERLRVFVRSRNHERTDTEHVPTQAVTLNVRPPQATETNEHINNNNQNVPVSPEPPPSYDTVVFNQFQPPPSYEEVTR